MSDTLVKQVTAAASAASATEAGQSVSIQPTVKSARSSQPSSDYYQLEKADEIRSLEDGTPLVYQYNERVPLLSSAGVRLKSPTKKQLEDHIIDFRVINPGRLHQIVFIDTASKPTDVHLGAAIWEYDITLDELVWLRSEDGSEFAICLNAFVSLPGGGKNKPRVIQPKLFRLGDKTAHLAQSREMRQTLLKLAAYAPISRTQHACPLNNAVLNTHLKDPTKIAQQVHLIKTHGNCVLGKCGKETIRLCVLPPPLFSAAWDDTKEPTQTVEIEPKHFCSQNTEDRDAETEDDESEEKKKPIKKRKSTAKAGKGADEKPVRKRKTKEETKAEKTLTAASDDGGDVTMSDGNAKSETKTKAPRKSKKKSASDDRQPDAASALMSLGDTAGAEANSLGVHQIDVELVKGRPVEGYLAEIKKKLSVTCPTEKFTTAYRTSMDSIIKAGTGAPKIDVSKATQAIHSLSLSELFAENDQHLRDLLVKLTRFTTLRDDICARRNDQTLLNVSEVIELASCCDISPEQIAMVLPVMWACMEMYGTNDGLKKEKHAKIFSEVKEIRAQRLMMEDLASAPSASTPTKENAKSDSSAAAAATAAVDSKLMTPPPVERKVPDAPKKKTSRTKRRINTDSVPTAPSSPSGSTVNGGDKVNAKSAEPDLSGPVDPLTSMIAPVIAEANPSAAATAAGSDDGPATKKTKLDSTPVVTPSAGAVTSTAAVAVASTAPKENGTAMSSGFKKPTRARIISASATDAVPPSLKRAASVATAAATAAVLAKMIDVPDISAAQSSLTPIAEDRPLSSVSATEAAKPSDSATAVVDAPVSSQMLDSDSMF